MLRELDRTHTRHSVLAVCAFTAIWQSERATVLWLRVHLLQYDRANAPQCYGCVCIYCSMTERTRHSVMAVCAFTAIWQSERATVFWLRVHLLQYDRANAPQCFGCVFIYCNMAERTRHSVLAACSFTAIWQSERATVFRFSVQYSYEPKHRIMKSCFNIMLITPFCQLQHRRPWILYFNFAHGKAAIEHYSNS